MPDWPLTFSPLSSRLARENRPLRGDFGSTPYHVGVDPESKFHSPRILFPRAIESPLFHSSYRGSPLLLSQNSAPRRRIAPSRTFFLLKSCFLKRASASLTFHLSLGPVVPPLGENHGLRPVVTYYLPRSPASKTPLSAAVQFSRAFREQNSLPPFPQPSSAPLSSEGAPFSLCRVASSTVELTRNQAGCSMVLLHLLLPLLSAANVGYLSRLTDEFRDLDGGEPDLSTVF